MKIKNFFVILLSILVLTAISFSIVRADDDEDDEEDDDDRYETSIPAAVSSSQDSVSKTQTPKMVTKRIVDPPKTIVVNEVRTVELVDTDRDGIADETDPHPDKAEIYFVSDVNQNGIVDSFEK